MQNILALIHPFFSVGTFILALVVLRFGLQRARFVHLHHKVRFAWKQHVFWGGIVILFWLICIGSGLSVSTWIFGSWGTMGNHLPIALLMLPMLILSFGSGVYMNKVKKEHPVLLPLHGINSLGLVLLALWQIVTGFDTALLFIG